jgi:hypothetical protein
LGDVQDPNYKSWETLLPFVGGTMLMASLVDRYKIIWTSEDGQDFRISNMGYVQSRIDSMGLCYSNSEHYKEKTNPWSAPGK